jgi:hypothetical protein
LPGVTAAAGAASHAGIPLTHRDYADACVFVTGHRKNGAVQLDWQGLVRPRQTIVVYMGVGGLREILAGLAQNGLGRDTPAALIERATLPEQRVVEGTLGTLPRLAERARVSPPALLIVGEVVRLRSKLAWHGRAPQAVPQGSSRIPGQTVGPRLPRRPERKGRKSGRLRAAAREPAQPRHAQRDHEEHDGSRDTGELPQERERAAGYPGERQSDDR